MRHAHAAESARQIFDKTAPIIIRQPVFEIMEPRKIFARALTSTITIQLDVVQQPLRRPVLCGFIEHASEAERDFVKRPAIHAGKIHGRRFHAVIDLQCV